MGEGSYYLFIGDASIFAQIINLCIYGNRREYHTSTCFVHNLSATNSEKVLGKIFQEKSETLKVFHFSFVLCSVWCSEVTAVEGPLV